MHTGRIYKLTNSENKKYYYGSTILPLFQRLDCHMSASKIKSTKLADEIKLIGENKWNIEEIELLDHITHEGLKKAEGLYVNKYLNDPNCLNMVSSGICSNFTGIRRALSPSLKKDPERRIELSRTIYKVMKERLEENPKKLEEHRKAQKERQLKYFEKMKDNKDFEEAQKKKARVREIKWRESVYADPEKYANFKEKNKIKNQRVVEKRRANPEAIAAYNEKQRERAKKNNALRKQKLEADPEFKSKEREKQNELQRKRRADKKISVTSTGQE